ncbi:MAG: DUF6127 family protein [Alphaproteobacteria bacterium]
MTTFEIDADKLDTLLEDAARRGATEALARVGLNDEGSANDIRDLRELLTSWREAKSAFLKGVAKALGTLVLGLLLIGLGFKIKEGGWLG